ncbi:MAG: NUDIX hydrolase [Parcubacteria group bacterium Gr01-1014_46]|nr:MAG: NUDIX hydrolase [Parcubacteria group bacterium Gr01-1014_46]
MKVRNKAVPAVYLILEKDGRILLGRRVNTGYQDGNYQMPAGHVEEGELPTEALVREAKEEIGIDINPKDLELVHLSCRPKHDESGDRIDIFFKAKNWNGEVVNMEPNKCEDLGWFSPSEFPKNIVKHVAKALEEISKGNIFNEISLDFLKQNNLYLLG